MRSIDAVCAILSNSLPTLTKNAADDKRDIGGPLAEAPHEVRKPFTAEWDVHPNIVAGGHERGLKIAPNAVQHLKFELVGRDPVVARDLSRARDQCRIVCRNSRVVPGGEHRLHDSGIGRIDI